MKIKERGFGSRYVVLDDQGQVVERERFSAARGAARRHVVRTKKKTWLVQVIAVLEVSDGGDGEEKTDNSS